MQKAAAGDICPEVPARSQDFPLISRQRGASCLPPGPVDPVQVRKAKWIYAGALRRIIERGVFDEREEFNQL